MRSKIAKHGSGICLFLSVFLASAYFIGLGNDVAFSSGEWLAADSRDRGRMAEDLIAGGSLVGKNIGQVRSTLGTPERNWGTVYQYQIDLGWPMKKPDTYGLQVHFDQEGKVKLVKIVD